MQTGLNGGRELNVRGEGRPSYGLAAWRTWPYRRRKGQKNKDLRLGTKSAKLGGLAPLGVLLAERWAASVIGCGRREAGAAACLDLAPRTRQVETRLPLPWLKAVS